jgi:hypothetical protein
VEYEEEKIFRKMYRIHDGRANEFGPWVGQQWGWEVGRWGLLGRSELYSIFKKLAKVF